jgi:hypothetical protein
VEPRSIRPLIMFGPGRRGFDWRPHHRWSVLGLRSSGILRLDETIVDSTCRRKAGWTRSSATNLLDPTRTLSGVDRLSTCNTSFTSIDGRLASTSCLNNCRPSCCQRPGEAATNSDPRSGAGIVIELELLGRHDHSTSNVWPGWTICRGSGGLRSSPGPGWCRRPPDGGCTTTRPSRPINSPRQVASKWGKRQVGNGCSSGIPMPWDTAAGAKTSAIGLKSVEMLLPTCS